MVKTVRPDLAFLSKPGTILRCGEEYEATANRNGAISGICENGEALGVRPGEFEFISLSKLVFDIWNKEYPLSVQNAIVDDHYDSSGTCGICEYFIPVDGHYGRCHGKGDVLPPEMKCRRYSMEEKYKSAVKFHRVAMGLTQKQIAKASGVNIRAIQKVENGEVKAGNMTAKNLLAIADALKVDMRLLLEE